MSERGIAREGDVLHLLQLQGPGTRCGQPTTSLAKPSLDDVMWRQDADSGAVNFLRPALTTLCPACEELARADWAVENPAPPGVLPRPWALVFG